MILFEGFFIALFLLPAAFALRPFLAGKLAWPSAGVAGWTKASVLGTIAAVVATLVYAFTAGGFSAGPGEPQTSGTAAQYLTVAIGFPLIVGAFQAVAVRSQLEWPALWPVVPAAACAVSYAASQLFEMLEAVDRSGLVTLAITLVAAFFIAYSFQRVGLRLLRPRAS